MKWWIGIISCTALFLIIGVFSYAKMSFLIKGVKIVATIQPQDSSSLVVIKGIAAKATHLTLNGREIFIDKDGNFSEAVAMLPGFSIITLDAKDKFGKTAEKKFEVVTGENAKAIAFRSVQIIN